MNRHSLSLSLRNDPGALARVVVLFASRGVVVESLSLDPTERSGVSRLDVVLELPPDRSVTQLVKQLGRLYDVELAIEVTSKAA